MNFSVLDSVQGIGPKTKEKLFNRFKSINDILEATEDDLLNIKGINKKIAKEILGIKIK